MRAMCMLLAAAVLLGACADVCVRKVTQENSSSIEGFRYYLPRPFVSVKAAMPVAGDDFIVNGSYERGVVTVAKGQVPEWMAKQHFRTKNGEVHIPAGTIYDSTVKARAAQQDGEEPKAEPAPEAPAPEAEKPSGGTAEAGSAPQDPEGYGSLVVDAGGQFFNVIYLPDFNEQYAIDFEPGLGRAGTGANPLRLRHGWMLESISVDVDNTKLGEFIFAQIDRFTGILGKLLEKEIGIAPPEAPPEAAPQAGDPAEGGDPAAPQARAVAKKFDVSLRITYVIEAQPGLYPVLKPCEQERFTQDSGRFEDFRYSKTWTFVPYTPLTVVPYNVKRKVIVEALSLEPAESSKPSNPAEPAEPDASGRVQLLADADAELKKLFPFTQEPESKYLTPGAAIKAATVRKKHLTVDLQNFKDTAAKEKFAAALELLLGKPEHLKDFKAEKADVNR